MITLLVKRKTATHARLTWQERGLRIEWGYFRRLLFHPVSVEMCLFADYPELLDLFDGEGWNLDGLYGLLSHTDDTALPEAVTVLLMQKDIDLLAAAGLELA